MIWLIGCKGMLGTEVANQLKQNNISFIGTDSEVDITDFQALSEYVTDFEKKSYLQYDNSDRHIKWIINCAAYTNVEYSEEQPELAKLINSTGALNIARVARNIGAKLIHISTDYVFNGKKKQPYTEEDVKNPINIYGKSKAEGETLIQKEMNQYYIIRTSWLYGFEGKNFVYLMTKLMNNNDSINVLKNQIGTPTFAGDLASIILKFIKKSENAKYIFGKKSPPAFGIYNFSDGGETTWYDFAVEIYKYGKKYGRIKNQCQINPCTSDEYKTKAIRPEYSVLNKEKICKEFKIKLTDWKINLEKFIKSSRFDENF